MTQQAIETIRGLRTATVAVRGGAHAPSSTAVCDDGMMIDLSLMNSVIVDPDARRPRADGGALLPTARSVLAVIARPGQESEELGGLLQAFRQAGASLSLLCLTRGEASPRNSALARLEAIRPWELQLAATVLGISELTVSSYPDGELRQQPTAELAGRIHRAIRRHRADLLLTIGPETGGRDDIAVAVAAREAAAGAGVPVAARTRPGVPGAWMIDLGTGATVARTIQKSAAGAHASQSEELPAVLHRLDLLDGREPLRWLLPPRPVPAQGEAELTRGRGRAARWRDARAGVRDR
jgi:N-acetylglucosamine malate deacetylase 2